MLTENYNFRKSVICGIIFSFLFPIFAALAISFVSSAASLTGSATSKFISGSNPGVTFTVRNVDSSLWGSSFSFTSDIYFEYDYLKLICFDSAGGRVLDQTISEFDYFIVPQNTVTIQFNFFNKTFTSSTYPSKNLDYIFVYGEYLPNVVNLHSVGAYPVASIGSINDSYAGYNLQKSTGNSTAFSGDTANMLVYGNYNFTDNINIYITDSNGNVPSNGIYNIDLHIPIDGQYEYTDSTNQYSSFSLAGGFIEVVSTSGDFVYSFDSVVSPVNGSIHYDLHIVGNVPVVNGVIGNIILKQYVAFGYNYSRVDRGYNSNGVVQHPSTTTTSLDTLPYITYSGDASISLSDFSIEYVSSSTNTSEAVDKVGDLIQQEHQEQIDKGNEALGDAQSGIDNITNVFSTWEILMLPYKFIQDFYNALHGDGTTTITFPSFTLMGHELWPSYTFDLSFIKTSFPLIFDSLYIIVGILETLAFISYCRSKFNQLTQSGGE